MSNRQAHANFRIVTVNILLIRIPSRKMNTTKEEPTHILHRCRTSSHPLYWVHLAGHVLFMAYLEVVPL